MPPHPDASSSSAEWPPGPGAGATVAPAPVGEGRPGTCGVGGRGGILLLCKNCKKCYSDSMRLGVGANSLRRAPPDFRGCSVPPPPDPSAASSIGVTRSPGGWEPLFLKSRCQPSLPINPDGLHQAPDFHTEARITGGECGNLGGPTPQTAARCLPQC